MAGRPPTRGRAIAPRTLASRRAPQGWFALDVLTVIPFDLVVAGVSGTLPGGHARSELEGASGSSTLLKIPRLLRLLRLLKLMRVLRASRIIARYANSISLTYATRTLILWVVIIVLCLHLFACLWALLPQLMGSLRDSLSAEQLHQLVPCGCTPLDDSSSVASGCSFDCLSECELVALGAHEGLLPIVVAKRENWMCRFAKGSAVHGGLGVITPYVSTSVFEVYVACLFVALQVGGSRTATLTRRDAAQLS